jgi:uncharacterized protein YbbC (DUF1343 family)
MPSVQTGLENLLISPPECLFGSRIGLLCNPASVDRNFNHAAELISNRFPGQLKALYSPQHGYFSEKQDNMIESDHMIHATLDIPVISLYGKTRIPDKSMLDPIDILIIDLQDVGTRVYTFIYTMSYCLEAAKRFGKKVMILDRPNPINGNMIEGNLLDADCASFVGRYPIPMRHGLTIGELSLLFNNNFGIGCDLVVIPMKGWKRDMFFMDTGLPWVPPSPNMPSPISAMVYPGQVLWEGTNVSEGRGTTLPFEMFGAPFFDTTRILSALDEDNLPGVILRPIVFEPTFGKWSGASCNGFHIHITDPYGFKPFITTLRLLRSVILHHNDMFQWKPPPYEYEFERLPFDLIIGDKKIRQRIEHLDKIAAIEESWRNPLKEFAEMSLSIHLYK